MELLSSGMSHRPRDVSLPPRLGPVLHCAIPTSQRSPVTIAKFCPECGTPTSGSKFCPECGTPTSTGAATPVAAAAPQERPGSEGEQEVWRGTPDPVLSPVAARTTSYVVTTERLRVSGGLIGKRGESMELYRIKDVSVKKSMTQRARGRGDVVVRSVDSSTPEVKLESVPAPDEVAETIRRLVSDARRKQNIIIREGM